MINQEGFTLKHTGRHTGAFLLLFLAKGPTYGGDLLQRCEQELPFNPIDSAILYRTLKKLEEEGFVTSILTTSPQNKMVKMYQMTSSGRAQLDRFHEDIEQKLQNLLYFQTHYAKQVKSDG